MGAMREDTLTILRVGGGIFTFGALSAILVPLSGGMTMHGPRNGMGWTGLIFALGSLPLAGFLLLLGAAKWYEDKRR